MTALVPPTVALPTTAPDDPRVGHLLGRALGTAARPRAVLVGFPSDEGVRRNGGRVGAAMGPAAIRQALYRMTPDPLNGERFTALLGATLDLGDVAVSGDLQRDQEALGAAVASHLAEGAFVILLGGGHETTFGHFLGYAAAGRRVELLNWDAHPDVRALREGQGHSGSPFRQALEHPSDAARRYVVAGLARHATAAAHVDFAAKHGRAVFREETTPTLVKELYARLEAPALVSFDLDVIDQTAAPGVSAPAADGLPAALLLDAAELAGRTPAVSSADVVELAPPFDPDGRTARLAALMVWRLLRGLALRQG